MYELKIYYVPHNYKNPDFRHGHYITIGYTFDEWVAKNFKSMPTEKVEKILETIKPGLKRTRLDDFGVTVLDCTNIYKPIADDLRPFTIKETTKWTLAK